MKKMIIGIIIGIIVTLVIVTVTNSSLAPSFLCLFQIKVE